ncbi:MAG: YhbY family RNA-binding protein [Nanoarchaeota archaeon]|nr:YhbY family RNA-binding protein [Nanoarchaeota archaeon]
MAQSQVQIGKNGVTANFISTLENHFKNRQDVKVTVLKSARTEKEKIKEYREEILNKLGKTYSARIIGFSIFVKKWRREVR